MYTLMLVAFMTHMTKPEELYQLWTELSHSCPQYCHYTILVTKSNDEVENEDQPLVQGI